jgi:hypothetical protein
MTTKKEHLIANVLYGIASDLEVFGDDPGARLSIADRARRFATNELGGIDPFRAAPTAPTTTQPVPPTP